MWKTSFIQFLKIIRQNKFFTFLNLFGISITIMIVLIAAMKIENTIWPGGPERNSKQMLFVGRELLRHENQMMSGDINLGLVEDYFAKMTSPKAIAFSSETPWSYFGDRGVEEFNLKNVNAGWWQVFDYEFTEGRPFGSQEVSEAGSVAVIDEEVKNRFFPNKKASGEMLEVAGKMYKIVGVVRNVPSNCTQAFANIFVPYTLTKSFDKNLMQTGEFSMVFLGTGSKNTDEIIDEFENIRKRVVPLLEDGFDLFFSGPDNALGTYLRGWENPDRYEGHTVKMMKIMGRFLLVLLLPALNLISIQLIRIYERSEEIGVRKAFGATRNGLIKQILYENTLLTFFGAVLGLVMSLIIVYGFRDFIIRMLFSDFGEGVSLNINYGLFLVSMLASLVLSLISGIIPAIKMSRLQAVDVLKGGQI